MIRIADARTVVDSMNAAKTIMCEIAHLECEIAYSEAMRDKQIQGAKERHSIRIEQRLKDLADKAKGLSSFILANKTLFVKPRKVTTEYGSFGLQAASELKITDEEALLQALNENGYTDSFKVVETPDKTRVKERLKDGEIIPGCALNEGDTAVYKTAKAMLDDAKDKAGQ